MKGQTITLFLAVVISALILGCGSSANNKQKPVEKKPVKVETTTKQPVKEIGDVQLTAKVENIGGGKYKVSGTTNLPDGYSLMIELSNQEEYMTQVMKLPPDTDTEKLSDKQIGELVNNSYRGATKYQVKNGKYEVTLSGTKLKPGNYNLVVSGAAMSVQPNKEKLKDILGAKGEKLKGKVVHKGVTGNYISMEQKVVLQ